MDDTLLLAAVGAFIVVTASALLIIGAALGYSWREFMEDGEE